MTGPCAKTTVTCTIVASDGEKIVGTNYCENPQEVCPRGPGEGYEKCASICRQVGHAEQVAVRLAGDKAKGARAFIEGHTYACQDCQEALYGAGVLSISVLPMKGDTMTKTDTSREAVERLRRTMVGSSCFEQLLFSKSDVEQALTERDALQARAERAEAALGSVMHLLDGEAWDFARATLAQLDAEPAGDTRCQECGCENANWFAPNDLWNSVMGGPDATDDPGGVLCPTCFIRRAGGDGAWSVTPAGVSEPTHREVWEQAKEAAAVWHDEAAKHDADGLEYSSLVGIPISNAAELRESVEFHEYSAKSIRAMPYPGDSQ